MRKLDVRRHVTKDEEQNGAIISHELYFLDPRGQVVSIFIKGDGDLLRTIADLLRPALPQ